MEEVHLTPDAIRIDHPEHVEHYVYKFYPGPASPGVAATMHVRCSCGMMFKLSGKPRSR